MPYFCFRNFLIRRILVSFKRLFGGLILSKLSFLLRGGVSPLFFLKKKTEEGFVKKVSKILKEKI